MLSNSSNMLFKQHMNDKIQSKYSLITGHIMPAALLYKIENYLPKYAYVLSLDCIKIKTEADKNKQPL